MTNRARTCSRNASIFLLLLSLGAIGARAQEQGPNCDANTAIQRASQLIGNKEYDQASELLKQFRTCLARSPLENFQLGWFYGRARRFGDTLEVFETVPHDVFRDAYNVLSEEVRRTEADLTTYLNLVTVCAEGGDFTKAAEFAAQAKQLPNSADAWVVLGAAETMIGHLDLAFEEFVTDTRLNPVLAGKGAQQ